MPMESIGYSNKRKHDACTDIMVSPKRLQQSPVVSVPVSTMLSSSAKNYTHSANECGWEESASINHYCNPANRGKWEISRHVNSISSDSEVDDEDGPNSGALVLVEKADTDDYDNKVISEAMQSPTERKVGKKTAFCSSTDALVEEIIRKTRRTALTATAAGSNATYGSVVGDEFLDIGPIPSSHPCIDARYGLLTFPLVPREVCASSTFQGNTQTNQQLISLSPVRDPDYIGDAQGNIYSVLPPAVVNACVGFAGRHAGRPTHQEFVLALDWPEEAPRSSTTLAYNADADLMGED